MSINESPAAPAATATPSSTPSPTTTAPGQRFESLPLNPATLANLAQLGYLEMTPIQAKT